MAKAVIRKPKKKVCQFCKDKVSYVDYKDTNLLRKFISDRGKIRARRVTGNCVQHQRDVATAVKNAREVALLPYTSAGALRGDREMKLILTQEVTGLGSAGDVVDVSDGYGRNYLVPRGFASSGPRAARRPSSRSEVPRRPVGARHRPRRPGEGQARGLDLQRPRPRGRGRPALRCRHRRRHRVRDQRVGLRRQVDKRTIVVGNPIKSLGAHTVTVRVHDEVEAQVNLNVVSA